MINKKLLAAASIAAVITSSSAFAKTEGSYVGLDLVRTGVDHQYTNAKNVESTAYTKFEDHGLGAGLNYKYAFNFGGFFIAPGAFAQHLGTKSQDADGNSVKITNQYGLKADLGYDITNNIAAYFTNGITRTNYKIDWNPQTINNHSYGYFLGAGLNYSLTKQLSVNLEYNMQTIDLKAPRSGSQLDRVRTDLSVVKLGLAYNF